MPIYDYRCSECGHSYVVVESLAKHEKGEHKCPKCGSAKVERVLAPASVHTSKKS